MKPLEGIKVIDLTRVLAGPFAAMILGDLGADVIKIEVPGKGDDARGIGPFKNGVSGYFMSINRGKKGLALNLKHHKGKAIFIELVKITDVLIENFRPGVMKRLGLGYEELSKINPRLIYAAISGFGQSGPYSDKPAYDMIIQGMGGIISITGTPGGPPVRVGTSIADLSSALFTVIGILAVLNTREHTGKGQLIDVAMLDSLVGLLENSIMRYDITGEIPQPLGARHPSITPFEAIKSKDGYVILALSNEDQWQRFIQAVGVPDLKDDKFSSNALRTENYESLKPILDKLFSTRTTDEWIQWMSEIGIPCGPINNIEEVLSHPQIKFRKMIADVEHPKAGKFRIPSCPIHFSNANIEITERAPDLGEHTAEILKEVLGLSSKEINELAAEGVIADTCLE